VDNSISELEDKIEIKEKTEEILVKQLKSCEKNMKELSNSIKRPNLRIMSIVGEEIQTNGICTIFNKIIIENIPNKHREERKNIEGCKGKKTNNM
jgi:hypothetical protein